MRTPRRRASEGYTLVEVVIATLLIAIMASSVFSVALTSKQGGAKAQRKMIAGQAAKQLTSMLRNYVTADRTSVAAQNMGPNSYNSGLAKWSVESTATSPPINCVDHAGTSEYALTPGSHTITGILPGWFEDAPYNAQLQYHVCGDVIGRSNGGCMNAASTSDGSYMAGVTVTIDWDEP